MPHPSEPKPLIGESQCMRQLRTAIRAVSRRVSTVLINGESGTGKELVAQHIHHSGPISDQPFVPVDCSTLRDTLFESQLFGHIRGAFTGADRDSLGFFRAADGGTLFLDEIGELAPYVQARLLRCIQERAVVPVGAQTATPVNVRIITATHRDLIEMVNEGEFREDLFFRLNVVELQVPPLRERIEDIIPLAKHFAREMADFYQEPAKDLTADAYAALEAYDWPGNVRELANAFERIFALCNDQQVAIADLPPAVRDAATRQVVDNHGGITPLDEAERLLVEHALRVTKGNQARAAHLLHIDRRRLYRLVRRFGLRRLTRPAAEEAPEAGVATKVGHENEKNQFLKASEVAAKLGCDPATVRREVTRGNLPAYRIGPRGDIRISVEAVDRYLDEHPVRHGAE